MIHKTWRRLLCVLLIITIGFVSGCGLGKETREAIKKMPQRITDMRATVKKSQDQYAAFNKKSDFTFFALYAEREKWDKWFAEANAEVTQAEKIYKDRITPLRKRNKKNEKAKAYKEIRAFNTAMLAARKKSKLVNQRMGELKRYQKEAPKILDKANSEMPAIDEIMGPLTALINKAKVDYPKRESDITANLAPLQKIARDAQEQLKIAQTELENHNSGKSTDYAKLGDGGEFVAASLEDLTGRDKALRSKINELYQSYTKILEDMREEYYVQIGRTSWNSYSDWNTDSDYTYRPRKVDLKTYEYYANLNPEMTIVSGLGRYRDGININKSMWNELNISRGESWPRGHDDAGFWISDLSEKYYHKYTIIQEKDKTTTDWVEVSEDDYEEYFDYIGMEIVSKPYGVFEEEKIKEASPAGMSMVDDTRYGEWRKDSSGRSFWYYYGIYSFMNMGSRHRYYHSDWNNWNRNYRNQGAYYGSTIDKKQKYGTGGTYVRNSTRYKKTHFSKSGGFKRSVASVRNAGPSMRGRGPGGMKGK